MDALSLAPAGFLSPTETVCVPIDFPGVPFWLIPEPGFLHAVLSTCCTPLADLLLDLHLDPEDGGSNVLGNADELLWTKRDKSKNIVFFKLTSLFPIFSINSCLNCVIIRLPWF
jgi:hypothetical protein